MRSHDFFELAFGFVLLAFGYVRLAPKFGGKRALIRMGKIVGFTTAAFAGVMVLILLVMWGISAFRR